jgi:hypothetical protein
MTQRYRFTDRDGPFGLAPRRDQIAEQHYHIWLPEDRPRANDANAGAPGERSGVPRLNGGAGPADQGEEGEPQLLCRLLQDGRSVEWAATGPDGQTPLTVRAANDGALEIWHHPNREDENGDAAPSGEIGLHIPPGSHEPEAASARQRALPGSIPATRVTRQC